MDYRGLTFWKLISEDLDAHFGDWTRPGFRSIVAHRIGTFAMMRRPGPMRSLQLGLHGALARYCRVNYGIDLPLSATIGRRCTIPHQHGSIVAPGSVIGDDAIIRHRVVIGCARREAESSPPLLGSDCNIGAGAKIGGNLRLGDHIRINANTVVETDIVDGSRVFSAPGRSRPGPSAQNSVTSMIGFWKLVREDWRSNGRDWTRPGFRALFVYRIGFWARSIRPALIRRPLSLLSRLAYRTMRNRYGIELPETAVIGRRVEIGDRVILHFRSQIEDDVILQNDVTLGGGGSLLEHEAPVLEAGAFIGAGTTTLAKVRIGTGARVAPNSVVMSDIKPGATLDPLPLCTVHAT